MRKTFTRFIPLQLLLLVIAAQVMAQGSIQGLVEDEKQQPVPYATVQLQGTGMGATTDEDGNYTISHVAAGTYTLQVTYVGYATYAQQVIVASSALTVNISLKPDYQNLSEVVVVGYGTKQIKDLTGSVSSVGSDQFLNGNIQTPEALIAGKVAGVTVTSNSGMPGAGSTIRIRGGTSLNASNDPLIVIDGVPVDNNSIAGAPSPLSMINPNDIENITVLKDASAAAIYGSRAANGVIIITTKKGVPGKNKVGVEFNTNNSISQIYKYVPHLSGDQLRAIIDSAGTTNMKKLIDSTGNTDWQKQIYQTAFSSDNNLTIGGGIPNVPYRFSWGFLHQEGVLKRSEMDRNSLSLNVNPSLLDDHLTIALNLKYSYAYNFFANQGAIGTAVTYDPSKPVYSDTSLYGGYWEWIDPTTHKPASLAPRNPLGLINQQEDNGHANRYIGNIQFDYKMHFLPELRANLNLGGDWTRSNGTVFIDSTAAAYFTQKGQFTQYDQKKTNKLLEFYLNYTKDIADINSKIDLTAGYSYQDWLTMSPIVQDSIQLADGTKIGPSGYPTLNAAGDTIFPGGIPYKTENTLISFYGRLNYTFMDRYLLTVTLRDDGSSRFAPDNRWGLFPSAAFAWRISDENFLKNSKTISNLKLRLGYGVTGQQDIFNDYPYIANYAQGDPTAQYQFGNEFYYVLRPAGYDANIKWEQTITYNAGIDFGFINGRINGSLDVYDKKTSDLLSTIPVPAGTNFSNYILTNVGAMENKGVEFTLDVIPYDKKDFTWDIGGNVFYNHNEITKLNKVEDTSSVGVLTGGISGGVGNSIQIQAVGYPTYSFYVLQQLYDANGNPLEGQYTDFNGDGKNTPDDRYIYKKAAPDVTASLYSSFRYKNWTAGFQLRGSWGNWLYNNVASDFGWLNSIDGSRHFINNLVPSYLDTKFQKAQYTSDIYVENASFIKCDNINIGYDFKNLISKKFGLMATFAVQNVFTITKYSGLDPEIQSGIDNNIFPRPTIYSIDLDIKL